MMRPIADLAACLVFFTRLPLPRVIAPSPSLAPALWAVPLIGGLIGAFAGAVQAATLAAGVPPGAAAGLAIATSLVLTGCLHEDGAADMADGFGGGATRERKLEIMRDSRIGTYGAATLVVSILLRWSALASLGAAGHAVPALIAAHAAARALLPAFMRAVPPARADGRSAAAGLPSRAVAGGAIVLGGLALAPLGIGPAIMAVLLLAFWSLGLAALCRRQVGGQTGDVLGGLEQGGEIIILLLAAATLR